MAATRRSRGRIIGSNHVEALSLSELLSGTVLVSYSQSFLLRGVPGLPVAQRLVLSPQSTLAGVRPIARMPIGVPTACSAAAPSAYVVILRVNRRTATILKRYDSARKRAIDSCKAQTNAGINGPSLSHEASKP